MPERFWGIGGHGEASRAGFGLSSNPLSSPMDLWVAGGDPRLTRGQAKVTETHDTDTGDIQSTAALLNGMLLSARPQALQRARKDTL